MVEITSQFCINVLVLERLTLHWMDNEQFHAIMTCNSREWLIPQPVSCLLGIDVGDYADDSH